MRRRTTVLECRPTTHVEEILRVVRSCGIDEALFKKHTCDGSAEAVLEQELACTRSMGIHALPAYLIQYKEKALLLQSFAYADFTAAIRTLLAC